MKRTSLIILLIAFVVLLVKPQNKGVEFAENAKHNENVEIQQMKAAGLTADWFNKIGNGSHFPYYFKNLSISHASSSAIFVPLTDGDGINADCSQVLVDEGRVFGKLCWNVIGYTGVGILVEDKSEFLDAVGFESDPTMMLAQSLKKVYQGESFMKVAEDYALKQIIESGGSVDKLSPLIFPYPSLHSHMSDVLFSGYVWNLSIPPTNNHIIMMIFESESPIIGECGETYCRSLENFTGHLQIFLYDGEPAG